MSFLAIFAKIVQGERNRACSNCRAAAYLLQIYVKIARASKKGGYKTHFAYKEARICGNELLSKIYNSAQSSLFSEIAPGYKVISWRNLRFFRTLRRVIN